MKLGKGKPGLADPSGMGTDTADRGSAASGGIARAGARGALWQGLAVVVAGLLAAESVLRRCRRRLGGVTGDVLGAGIEVSLTVSLAIGALLATA